MEQAPLEGARSAHRPHARSLVPREHGAYGQLFVPLAGALVVVRFAPLALAVAVLASVAFFAHEPALVLLGHRGARAREENAARALRRIVLLALAGLAPVAAIVAAGARPLALSLALPLALGAVVVALMARRLEKTTAGELVAAAALSSWSWPTAVAGGASLATGALAAFVFTAAFASSTLSVRAVLAQARRRPAGPLRAASLAVALAGMIVVACSSHPLAAAAIAPAAMVGAALALVRPRAKRLREIGWSLVAAGAATAVVVTLTMGSAR